MGIFYVFTKVFNSVYGLSKITVAAYARSVSAGADAAVRLAIGKAGRVLRGGWQ